MEVARTPAQPPRGPRALGGRIGALVSWVVIAGFVAIMAVMQAMKSTEAPPPEEAAAGPVEAQPDAAPPGGMLEAICKSIVGSPPKDRAEALGMTPLLARSPIDRFRVAILTGYVNGPPAAEDALAQLSPDEGDPLARDIAALRSLYEGGEQAVEPAADERMSQRHGWFWSLARASVRPQEDELRAQIEADGRRTFRMIAAWEIGILAAFVASFVLFVWALVLAATGRIRRRHVAPTPGGSVYLETFAVFLVLLLPVLLVADLAEQAIGPAAGLVRWALLGVLAWPFLRGAKWQAVRAAAGWHVTPRSPLGFLKEVGMGLVGYLACLPIVGLGVGVTLGLMAIATLIRTQLGQEPPPLPVHPLGDMIAEAGMFQLILLVALATLWAPIVEETFFRGALYHHLCGRLHWALAGLANGFIFAAIHPQGFLAIPALTSIGFVLCLLREWRGSLVASMTAHALNNGAITLLLILMMKASAM